MERADQFRFRRAVETRHRTLVRSRAKRPGGSRLERSRRVEKPRMEVLEALRKDRIAERAALVGPFYRLWLNRWEESTSRGARAARGVGELVPTSNATQDGNTRTAANTQPPARQQNTNSSPSTASHHRPTHPPSPRSSSNSSASYKQHCTFTACTVIPTRTDRGNRTTACSVIRPCWRLRSGNAGSRASNGRGRRMKTRGECARANWNRRVRPR